MFCYTNHTCCFMICQENADCSMFGQEVLDRWTLETHLPQSHHYAYRATL